MIPISPRLLSTRLILSANGTTTTLTKACLASTNPASHLATASLVTANLKATSRPQIRNFHVSRRSHIREFFPEPDAPAIRTTRPAWRHPIYTEDQMQSIVVAHRDAKTWSDWTALSAVRILRWGLDIATWYKHEHKNAAGDVSNVRSMTEKKYMIRNIFLESVAGVPGMVAGMLRHLHSMRRMKRDNGWMETLLEESYNERMHLLTFLKMAEPGLFMRAMVLGAQGVFFNAFFVAYLISPATCHRFVGYLEEEAVITYTREIEDIDAGKLPLWADPKFQAPQIAVEYWRMPEGKRTMKDLLLYIRADEAKHREVNHTLGNLDQKDDPNPFVSEYKDEGKPHPGEGIRNIKPLGWEREEAIGEGMLKK